MGKPKVLELTEVERLALEKGFRLGEKHCFRMRCRAVLLKADGLSSAAAGVQTEMSQVSVNAWVKRFKSEGIDGLNTRSGRGRKPIMDCSDEDAVRRAIDAHLLEALRLQRSSGRGPLSPAALRDIQRLKRIVRYCSHRQVGTCLEHSLAAWRILDGRGVPSRIVIAPQTSNGEPFLAHAWIEVSEGHTIGRPIAAQGIFKRNDDTGMV